MFFKAVWFGRRGDIIIPPTNLSPPDEQFLTYPTNVHVKARRNDATGRNVHVRRHRDTNMKIQPMVVRATKPPLIMTNSTANIVHSIISMTPYELLLGGRGRRNEC